MIITESQLRRLISEALLTELFDAPPYEFKIFKMKLAEPDSVARARVDGKRILNQRVSYEFSSDDYGYIASFMLRHYGRLYPTKKVDPDAFYYWDITFSASSHHTEDAEGFSMHMTHQRDPGVLSTISSIVKNFATNVLPTIEDSDVRTFSFVGIQEGTRDPDSGEVLAWHKGDPEGSQSRRTHVYIGMLKRKLPDTAVILPTPPNVLDPANTIFFSL